MTAGVGLLIAFLAVDTSNFNFFGIRFQDEALITSLIFINSFYLLGYTIKLWAIYNVINKESKKQNEKENSERFADSTSTVEFGEDMSIKIISDDISVYKKMLTNESKIGYIVGVFEFIGPIIISIISMLGLSYKLYHMF